MHQHERLCEEEIKHLTHIAFTGDQYTQMCEEKNTQQSTNALVIELIVTNSLTSPCSKNIILHHHFHHHGCYFNWKLQNHVHPMFHFTQNILHRQLHLHFFLAVALSNYHITTQKATANRFSFTLSRHWLHFSLHVY